MTTPLLQVSELAVAYGDVQVVWNASLTVDEAAVVVLIGSNGAGKTTILRALSGLIHPVSGQIVLAGELIAGNVHFILGFFRIFGLGIFLDQLRENLHRLFRPLDPTLPGI